VLDAGSGPGDGAALLLAAGAASVTGIDRSADVVDVAAAAAPAGIGFDVGDVQSLPYADDSFDMVTCFDLIEHVTEPETALAELDRVLAPGGLVLVSWPGRDATGFERLVEARWPRVRLARQQDFLASTVLAGRPEQPGDPLPDPATVRLLASATEDGAVATIALASSAELPPLRQLVTLPSTADLRAWLDRFQEQQEVLRRLTADRAAAASLDADARRALRRLTEAEQALAEVPPLRAELSRARAERDELRRRLEETAAERDAAAWRADRGEATVRALQRSLSWRLTAPLRAAKRLIGGD
jgi:SAM-dependent methyltransferase